MSCRDIMGHQCGNVTFALPVIVVVVVTRGQHGVMLGESDSNGQRHASPHCVPVVRWSVGADLWMSELP